MKEFVQLFETYNSHNSYFRDYMKKAEFDPYANWYFVAKWLVDARGRWRVDYRNPNHNWIFTGKFEDCVSWVKRNFQQYRKVLTGA